MLKTLTITALFVASFVMKNESSYTEKCVGEFCFTTPGDSEMKNFDAAKSWCMDHNSTLSVVNDSETQTALTQLPNLLRTGTDSMMFINIKLSQQGNTWVLVNGVNYTGAVGNQQNSEYKLYCYLNPNRAEFLVEASKPSDLRKYLCDFEGATRCQSNSTSNFLFNNRCYVKYENENLTWYQARERCINNGGDLATFQIGSNPWIPPFNTSWLDPSLTYWVGIRWNGWSWKYSELSKEQIMGLGIGIGGGVLLIVIVATIVLAVFITRRKRKSKGNDDSESRPAVENNGENNDEVKPTEMTASDGKDLYSQVHKPPRNQVNNSRGKDVYAQVNKHPQNQVNNDVYAKVVSDGKQQINKIESSPETIYSAPEFAQDPTSKSSNSNYEVAYRVHEPDVVPTLRGQTQSIFPIRYSNAYANEKEAE